VTGRRIEWLMLPAVCVLLGLILGAAVAGGLNDEPDFRCTIKGDDVTCTEVRR
jgi:hypothetical protein